MNYTSIAQSKKLLELGLDRDTADAVYIRHCTSDNSEWRFDEDVPPMLLSSGSKISKIASEPENVLPCWSVGQLMKIIGNFGMSYHTNKSHDVISSMCSCEHLETSTAWELIDLCYHTIVWLLENGHIKKN